MKNYWLLKTEGDWYPIDKLKAEKKTPWSGVRNFQARNFMRDKMQVGDLCLFLSLDSKQNGGVRHRESLEQAICRSVAIRQEKATISNRERQKKNLCGSSSIFSS